MNVPSSCEAAFDRGGPFWHLYTDGEKMELIFSCPADYVFGITLLGLCAAAFPGCRILTFALMSTHLHIIMAGPEADIRAFFALFRDRLGRCLSRQCRFCRMENFQASLFRIPDLRALRNEIVYVNRNGYVVHPECTPFSYWWSAGVFFFSPVARLLPARPFGSLTLRDRRAMCHTREAELPDGYRVLMDFCPDGITQAGPLLLADSFCAIGEAERYFRDAHQYCRQVNRDLEAFSEVARRVGDRIFLTDDELYGAVSALCAREYGTSVPALLPAAAKPEIARRMHFDYNASNKQIQRMLKLAPGQVAELFPAPQPDSFLKKARI